MPPRIAVRDIAFFERPVGFVRPFRFGAVVINAASQVFVRVEIEIEGQGKGKGKGRGDIDRRQRRRNDGAELVSTSVRSFAGANVAELRRSLTIARELYLSHRDFETAFALHARCLAAQVEACAKEEHPAARRRLWAGGDRQGCSGCAAAWHGCEFL